LEFHINYSRFCWEIGPNILNLPLRFENGINVLAIVYGLLAVFTMIQALQGKPLFPNKNLLQDEIYY
jgi:hypothetical protein